MSTEPIEHAACRERTSREQANLSDTDHARAQDIAKACVQVQARLAPHFGFAGSSAPAAAWEDVYGGHRRLLTATMRELIPLIEQPLRAELSDVTVERDRWRRIVELLTRAAAGRDSAERVVELAEAYAAVSALLESWAACPGRADAARELGAALAGGTHRLAPTGA